MEEKHYDVIVIGGGPAGAAAAITLAKFSSLKVALLEAGNGEKSDKMGETTSPAIKPILDYLDALQGFEISGHEAWNLMKAAWGTEQLSERDFVFSGRGSGWHLDRRKFDQGLIDVACEKGVEIYLNTKTTKLEELEQGWKVTTSDGTEIREFFTSYLIDASGRKSVVAKHFKLEQQVYDRLACYMVIFNKPDQDLGEIVLETTPDGWWYATSLPGKRIAVAFMTDVDIAKDKGYNRLAEWGDYLCHTNHIYPMIEDAIPEGDLLIRSANTRHLTTFSGRNWISAGEAGISFDPLSSMGVGYAISSGIHAARLCQITLNESGFDLSQYQKDIETHFQEYFALYKEFYTKERRWEDEPFWKRRHAKN